MYQRDLNDRVIRALIYSVLSGVFAFAAFMLLLVALDSTQSILPCFFFMVLSGVCVWCSYSDLVIIRREQRRRTRRAMQQLRRRARR